MLSSQISTVSRTGEARTDLKPLATTSSQVWPLIFHMPFSRWSSILRVATASDSGTSIAGASGLSTAGTELLPRRKGSSVTSNIITLSVLVKLVLFFGLVFRSAIRVPGGYLAKSMTTS